MANRALAGQAPGKPLNELVKHQANILAVPLTACNFDRMSTQRPPFIDPVAAARWAHQLPRGASPWLHEEVARRMEERLQWIVRQPRQWVHWGPLRGGVQAHGMLTRRYAESECFLIEGRVEQAQAAHKLIAKSWWKRFFWSKAKARLQTPERPVQMLWANMALHMDANPMALMERWHQLLDVDGFLMFSCLGPDTLRELRAVYAALGWPPPAHEFTDMHDWGDMLVGIGFAEPVMDMERISLSFETPQRLLLELRGLGRNLGSHRFKGLRGRRWHQQLLDAIVRELSDPADGGRIKLNFEIIYGHAFKPAHRARVSAESSISLQQMRGELGLDKQAQRL